MPALCQEAFRLIPDRLDEALTMPFLLKEPSVWTLAASWREHIWIRPASTLELVSHFFVPYFTSVASGSSSVPILLF